MRYISRDELLEMLDFVKRQTEFIINTTGNVKNTDDFLTSQTGMILYNSTCMCLQTIGETIRKIDELTDKKLLSGYPQIPWRHIIGLRNIISHEYASTDPEKIYYTVKYDLKDFLPVISAIISDTSKLP